MTRSNDKFNDAGNVRRLLSDERGFGLVEILIVLVIIAILLAIAIPSFNSSKETARANSIRAAATIYGNAVNAYKLDNGNENPPAFGNEGPVHPVDGTKYIPSVPEVIQKGGAQVGGLGPYGGLAYTPVNAGAQYGFYIIASGEKGGEIVELCAVSTGVTVPGGLPAC